MTWLHPKDLNWIHNIFMRSLQCQWNPYMFLKILDFYRIHLIFIESIWFHMNSFVFYVIQLIVNDVFLMDSLIFYWNPIDFYKILLNFSKFIWSYCSPYNFNWILLIWIGSLWFIYVYIYIYIYVYSPMGFRKS